jgi:signal transduction histidine kinase
MRLSTRLSIFFLATVAVILAGFSAMLYAVASEYLHRQADERLEAALNTLEAAAEFSDGGLEWEPEERSLSFGRRTAEGGFQWVVCDAQGRRIDGSTPADADPSWTASIAAATSVPRSKRLVDQGGQPWRIMTRRLQSARAADSIVLEKRNFHKSLILGAAISLTGIGETLRNLGGMLIVLSCATWAIALLVGERLCRRALRPVADMAEAAHAIAGHGFDDRLPVAETGDELQGLGQAFNGLLERQHESHDRQRRFAGDASHQLRTPLTAMQGHVDVALRQPRSVEEYQRVLAVVRGKTRHMRSIVEAMLFLVRAEAESQQPPLEPIETIGWLRTHMAAWNASRPGDVRLEIDAEAATTHVMAHPILLDELLDNLLDNAVKYSDPTAPIVVHAGRDGDSFRVSVEDRGVGIEAVEIAHLVEPFYRTSQARSRDPKGVGLGLSVASRLARLFGGRLQVESILGRGSTFSIVLPTTTRLPSLDQKSVSI